jgi:hypothetical protein
MSIRESAVIKLLESRIQNYSDMINIAKESGCLTSELEIRMNSRIEEDQSLIKLFQTSGDENESRTI